MRMVHFFSVDLDAERRLAEGEEYSEKPFLPEERETVRRTASQFESKLQKWIEASSRSTGRPLYARFPRNGLFCGGYFDRTFHACFAFADLDEVKTNINQDLLYEFLREYVRELSKRLPHRWWKFDYRVFFKEGLCFRRDPKTGAFRQVELERKEAVIQFLKC